MKVWCCGVAALALSAGAAFGDPSTVMLFQHKHWEVEHVTFEDGSVACLAEVDAGTDSFTIWGYPDTSIKLQFYSTSWEFGESGEAADIVVQIGSREPWNLREADLYKNSILFTLPDSDTSVRFLMEVAQGNRLYLRNSGGEPIIDYSLSGSKASMQAMINCVEQI